MNNNWTVELPFAITVCDKEGNILEMNNKSQKTFEKWGKNLIGINLMNCHPEPAKSKLAGMLIEPKINAYTIEKNGIKKMIYQSPWYENGEFMGFVELSLEIPFEMANFVRS